MKRYIGFSLGWTLSGSGGRPLLPIDERVWHVAGEQGKILSMKKPQRNFVVEIKNSGRRRVARNTSIWGDTNLQAVAREIEDLLPPRIDVAAPQPISAPPAFEEPGRALEASSDGARAPSHVKFVDPIRKRQVRPSVKAAPSKASSSTDVREVGTGTMTRQALAELLDENRRLKALLTEKLRAQNTELQAMWDRLSGRS